MIPSPEYLALSALRKPTQYRVGDMWLCRRLGIVKVFNGHTRGLKRRQAMNAFHLYHWGKPSMVGHPCDWRDNDPNAYIADPANEKVEKWEYIGNIFEMLPYSSLIKMNGA